MTLGATIALYRRKQGITQDALAQKLGVTNQAVSKWESDQCCPDVMLLPKLADIFDISMDTLFGRERSASPGLPWEDDDTLHVVLYAGHRLLRGHSVCKEIRFYLDGPAMNVNSAFSVTCGEVMGSVTAGTDVNCDTVMGDVSAGGSVTCDEVHGPVRAGGNVTCDDVNGNASAGGNMSCGDVEGNVTAGGDVECDSVEGSVCAGRDIRM